MADIASWIAVALVVGVAVVLVTWIRSFGPVRTVIERSFWCPMAHEDVTVAFLEEVWDGRPIESVRSAAVFPRLEVVRCSALAARPDTACGKRCLCGEDPLRA